MGRSRIRGVRRTLRSAGSRRHRRGIASDGASSATERRQRRKRRPSAGRGHGAAVVGDSDQPTAGAGRGRWMTSISERRRGRFAEDTPQCLSAMLLKLKTDGDKGCSLRFQNRQQTFRGFCLVILYLTELKSKHLIKGEQDHGGPRLTHL